jgi:hypothetical protein
MEMFVCVFVNVFMHLNQSTGCDSHGMSLGLGFLPVCFPPSNVGKFELPNPAGKAGGACTSALLQVLYRHHRAAETMSWVECLRKMRSELRNMGYDQVPELTSSRLIDVNKTMYIVPPGATGHRRAILIGINYTGQQGQLSGCHNDCTCLFPYVCLSFFQTPETHTIICKTEMGSHVNSEKH